jgi:peroxiredoxin
MRLAHGQPAPDFQLLGTDNREHSLADYDDAELLVLIQSCNHCPYVLAWEGRMVALQSEYSGRGVRFVAVNSNDAERYPEDSFEQMVTHASQQRFNFDYLHDPSQAVARALGAERTPEVFLFDRKRRLVYHGALDDSRDETAVRTRYLGDALDAALAGKTPPVADTPPSGCTVKWLPRGI